MQYPILSFVAFLAYCLQVTLKQRLRSLAPGLTPRSVLDRTGGGSGCPAPSNEDQPARSATSQGDRRRRSTIAMTRRHVVPTFTAPIPENHRSARFFPSSSERTVSAAVGPGVRDQYRRPITTRSSIPPIPSSTRHCHPARSRAATAYNHAVESALTLLTCPGNPTSGGERRYLCSG